MLGASEEALVSGRKIAWILMERGFQCEGKKLTGSHGAKFGCVAFPVSLGPLLPFAWGIGYLIVSCLKAHHNQLRWPKGRQNPVLKLLSRTERRDCSRRGSRRS